MERRSLDRRTKTHPPEAARIPRPMVMPMKTIHFLALALAPVFLAGSLAAQTTIAPAQPWAWGANVGWLNARPDAAFGVRTADTVCSGHLWSANLGWLNLGSGAPANGWSYSNAAAGDWGVNVQPDGTLRGYAWGANIGWVHFEAAGNPRVVLTTGDFAGQAWSANAGWLNLGDATFHPQTTTLAITDTDGDGISDAWEYEAAGDLGTLTALGDFDRDGRSDRDEYFADTDPLDVTDHLRLTRYDLTRPGGLPQQNLAFTSHSSRLYRLETRLSLTSGTWTDSGLGLFLGQSVSTLLDLGAPTPTQRFWRITAQRPLSP
jgi:Bacterial TSP3 repeat